MTVRIGTSGWQYDDWRGSFYPHRCPKRRWLEHYVERFETVESNNAFYRLPERSVFEHWRERTPDGFVIAVKASRYLTHIKRLQEPAEPVKRLMERATGLGDRLGPILLQLPPTLRRDLDSLDKALRAFPPETRVAVEPRHDSWLVPELRDLLERRRVALCLADKAGRHSPLWRTASWGYVRFHAGRASPPPSYGRRALERWAERVGEMYGAGEEVFAFFNNDAHTCAPRNAHTFALACARCGLETTRTWDEGRDRRLIGDLSAQTRSSQRRISA